jgi:hypothetical protein
MQAELPSLVPVRRSVPCPVVEDVEGAARAALAPLVGRLRPGMSVALTAGSRGVRDVARLLREAGRFLRQAGADPFIVPAMGSHGGATAEGQVGVLEHLGVTEATTGLPVRATMDVVEVGRLPDGLPLYMDAYAARADAVLVVCRVKPHTDFHGAIESGAAKMLAIGLGKRRGAETVHVHGPAGLARYVPEMGRALAGSGRVLGALAVVENPRGETARVELLGPDEIGAEGESRLLEESRRLLVPIPFEQVDVLVVDESGKDYSGSGMDPNVIGRYRIEGLSEPARPAVSIVVALGLSEASGGNGLGIGLADITTDRFVEAVDWSTTYLNALTSGLGGVRRAHLPVHLPTDREAIGAALKACGRPDPSEARVVRVHDTAHVVEMMISSNLLDELAALEGSRACGPARPMSFGPDGRLEPWSDGFCAPAGP